MYLKVYEVSEFWSLTIFPIKNKTSEAEAAIHLEVYC